MNDLGEEALTKKYELTLRVGIGSQLDEVLLKILQRLGEEIPNVAVTSHRRAQIHKTICLLKALTEVIVAASIVGMNEDVVKRNTQGVVIHVLVSLGPRDGPTRPHEALGLEGVEVLTALVLFVHVLEVEH